jgi:hypothetical protein
MDPTEQTPPDTQTETPIDYRTATPEEVAAGVAALRQAGTLHSGQDTSGIDWKNIPREEFYEEAAKRGIHLRRWGH